MTDFFGREDWLRRALGDVAPLILHIREQATPSLQASSEPRVSGSTEKTIAPLNIDPLDEADDLWARVCSLAIDHAGRTGNWKQLPDAIDEQWRVPTSAEITVRGFATSDPGKIYADVIAIVRYLRERAFTLTIEAAYAVPVDELIEEIGAARRRYPGMTEQPQHRHRCPLCLRYAVVPKYSLSGEIEQLRCEDCGATRTF